MGRYLCFDFKVLRMMKLIFCLVALLSVSALARRARFSANNDAAVRDAVPFPVPQPAPFNPPPTFPPPTNSNVVNNANSGKVWDNPYDSSYVYNTCFGVST